MTSPRPTRSELARLARTPRWLGLLALAIAFAVLAGLLGMWQWSRTQDVLAAERAARAEPVDIREVVVDGELPSESIGRPVWAIGEYIPGQLLIRDRECVGQSGFWVLTPLRLESGEVLGVLRGCVPSTDDPATVPTMGALAVSGIVHPDERFYADAAPADGVGLAVRTADAGWSGSVIPGFLMLTTQDPAAGPQPMLVPATTQTGDAAFPLQNFFYAIQWWVFALFGFGAWARWLWVDAADVKAADVKAADANGEHDAVASGT